MPKIENTYSQPSYKWACYVIDYQIKPPNQSFFLKLLVFITLQVVKTEYFPLEFHFYISNMTNEVYEVVCVMDFVLQVPENSHFIISPALTYLVFWTHPLICIFKMGWDVFVIIFSINYSFHLVFLRNTLYYIFFSIYRNCPRTFSLQFVRMG